MRVNEDKKTPRKRSEMFRLTFFLAWIDREIETFIFIFHFAETSLLVCWLFSPVNPPPLKKTKQNKTQTD